MIIGIGTDLFRCDRIVPAALADGDAFLERVYTERERAQACSRPSRHEYLAGRFCAKEAIYKAISACGEAFHPGDIEVVDNADGRPLAQLHGRTKRAFEDRVEAAYEIEISISYDDGCACAFAIAWSNTERN